MRRLVILAMLSVALLPASSEGQNQAPTKPPAKSTSDEQLRLRLRLRDNPHDQEAHKQLHKLLSANYAFRAEMEEDGAWLKNNPDDYSTEIDMNSLATVVLFDPEYAIAIEKIILLHADRSAYPEGYDGVIDHLSQILRQREKYKEALEYEREALKLQPDDSGVWENLGDTQVDAGDPSGALSSYRKSLDLDGNQEGPHEGLATAYMKLGDYKGAETELNAAIAIYNAQYHGTGTSDSFHEATKKMQEVTKMEPQLVRLHQKLATAYLSDGEFARALAEANAAIQANDPYGDYYLKASIYEAWGKPKEAADVRLQAHNGIAAELKKEKTPSMFDDMTYPELVFISTSPGNGDQQAAHEIIKLLSPLQSSGQLRPFDGIMLGFAYCDVGEYRACKEQAEAAMNLSAKVNTAVTNHNLGRAMMKGKDTRTALVHFQKAYELDPANTTYRMDYEQARQANQ
jgi:tetratricopeptide (TPR) repeat protein